MLINNRGFSFLECLMVLIIINIVLAMSVVHFNDFLNHQKDRLKLKQLVDLLNFAKEHALITHRSILFCRMDREKKCHAAGVEEVLFDDYAKQGEIVQPLHIIRKEHYFSKEDIFHWRSYPARHDYFLIHPQKYTMADNGTFWFCSRSSLKPVWAITMDNTAQMNIHYPDQRGEIRDEKNKALLC